MGPMSLGWSPFSCSSPRLVVLIPLKTTLLCWSVDDASKVAMILIKVLGSVKKVMDLQSMGMPSSLRTF